jgi:hypothetical protein
LLFLLSPSSTAERRVGELLKDLARSQGGSGRFGLSDDATNRDEPSPYAAALDANGITRQTAHRFMRCGLDRSSFRCLEGSMRKALGALLLFATLTIALWGAWNVYRPR